MINVWQGLAAGGLAVIQCQMTLGGGARAAVELKQRFSRLQVFGILGSVSTLGLGIGFVLAVFFSG